MRHLMELNWTVVTLSDQLCVFKKTQRFL